MPRAYERLKLTEAFVEICHWEEFTMVAFQQWASKDRKPKVPIDAHKMYEMKAGEPVPRHYVELFFEWLVLKGVNSNTPSLHLFSEHVDPVKEGKSPRKWTGGNYGYVLGTLLTPLLKRLQITDEGLYKSEKELSVAAEQMIKFVGRGCETKLDGAAAILRGKQEMKREVEEHAQLLKRLWRANADFVRFIPRRQTGGQLARDQPAGWSIVAAVTENFYQRFRMGQADDLDITDKDLLAKSEFLLIHSLIDVDLIVKQRKKPKDSMINALCFQMAAITPPMGEYDPSVITFAGHPDAEKALRSFYYQPTGYTTPLTKKPIYEWCRSQAIGLDARAQYQLFTTLLTMIQVCIAEKKSKL